MSERSARTWKDGSLPSASKKARDWRSRPDPFAEVWASELVPLLLRDDVPILEARRLAPGRVGEEAHRAPQPGSDPDAAAPGARLAGAARAGAGGDVSPRACAGT